MILALGWFWAASLFMGSGRAGIEVVISRQDAQQSLGSVISLLLQERLRLQAPS